jgi:hypothetical protein
MMGNVVVAPAVKRDEAAAALSLLKIMSNPEVYKKLLEDLMARTSAAELAEASASEVA